MMVSAPDFSIESLYEDVVCGVDEAGRGPLAGPVVAAAVVMRRDAPLPDGLNDSKKVPPARREALYDWLVEHTHYSIAVAEVDEIDRHNILRASLRAMSRAIEALTPAPLTALVDGNMAPSPAPCKIHTVVEGDCRSLSIAAASILAKVTRDRLMQEYARLYPQYGFCRHKGYSTPQHMQALQTYGPCPIHRKSFAPVKILLEQGVLL